MHANFAVMMSVTTPVRHRVINVWLIVQAEPVRRRWFTLSTRSKWRCRRFHSCTAVAFSAPATWHARTAFVVSTVDWRQVSRSAWPKPQYDTWRTASARYTWVD